MALDQLKPVAVALAIGDGPTVVLYLALSAVMLWVGMFTAWTFGRP